jgi:long-chain acyl-CoA synthetase
MGLHVASRMAHHRNSEWLLANSEWLLAISEGKTVMDAAMDNLNAEFGLNRHQGGLDQSLLGYTLPQLLDMGCDRALHSPALHQWSETGWRSYAYGEMRQRVEAMALRLRAMDLATGDRVALLLPSGLEFAIADLGCLLAGLVDVPIDQTQTLENILFILQHSQAKALMIDNLDWLRPLLPYLIDAPDLRFVLVRHVPDGMALSRLLAELGWAAAQPILQVFCLDDFIDLAKQDASAQTLRDLRQSLSPQDLATLIYIPSATGALLGVMLTHENLSGNALAAFAALPNLVCGTAERALFVLPFTHVFARCLLYGHLAYGHSLYFSHPSRLMKHLSEVQPTLLALVPLLLDKVYRKILERGRQLPWVQRLLFEAASAVANRYPLGRSPRGLYALLLGLARVGVLNQWRSLFGGQIKYILSGGAALDGEIVTGLAAAGVMVLQGYGLTQASAVVCFNRGAHNRAGTVGAPITGVEVAIAPDGEICLRSPYNTSGYYRDSMATAGLIDAQGWLHTGDLGQFTPEGLLRIVGLKKALFKLSTGKYIAPQPMETRLNHSPWVERAIVVGAERKFCAALILPNFSALHQLAQELHLNLSDNDLLQHPCILQLYQAVVDAANCYVPDWALIKRFKLIQTELTLENDLLIQDPATQITLIHRSAVATVFAQDIAQLYQDPSPRLSDRASLTDPETSDLEPLECPAIPVPSCPRLARSL